MSDQEETDNKMEKHSIDLSTTTPPTYAEFSKTLSLDPRISKALALKGYSYPTPVQLASMPLILNKGRDVLMRARTGAGKTVAYCVPLLQKVLKTVETREDGLYGMIVLPTRELVTQTEQVLRSLLYYLADALRVVALLPPQKDDKSDAQTRASLLTHPHILLATPTSIIKYLPQVSLADLHTLVMDESDLLLSHGYADALTALMKAVPKTVQGVLASATLSESVTQLKNVVLHKPAVVSLKDDRQGSLKQYYIQLASKDKFLLTYAFLTLGLLRGRGLVFCDSVDECYRLKLFLAQMHMPSAVLNKEMPETSRQRMLDSFNSGSIRLMITTDGAGVSRGVDFRDLKWVLNYTFPSSEAIYTHRIGRTARAGARGVALSFVTEGDEEVLSEVREAQPPLPLQSSGDLASEDVKQPGLLAFDLSAVEGFRYRVEDVSRAVTAVAVRDTRKAEIAHEMLNSERLKEHWEENPKDLQLLQSDSIRVSKIQSHLGHVPKYLVPEGMRVEGQGKRRKRKGGSAGRNTADDPLQNLGKEEESRTFLDAGDGTGKSTSGRKSWQERHGKGKFSKRYKSQEGKAWGSKHKERKMK